MFSGFKTRQSANSSSAWMLGPIFTPIGLAMPRKYSTWAPSNARVRSPIQAKCALRLYQPVRRGTLPRLRLLVIQVQALVAGEEFRSIQLRQRSPRHCFRKADRIDDRFHDRAKILRVGRMVDEIEVPQFGMAKIGESAVDQAADEVQRQRRPLVAAEDEFGVRRPGRGGELAAVDRIAPIARQRDAVAGFHLRRPRLGDIVRQSGPDESPADARRRAE